MAARFGYTLMTEQSDPRELVKYAAAAEAAGFDFEVSSDHFTPWLTSQGHSPHAWTVLGAVAQGWPSVQVRQMMLQEAIHIIRELHTGDLVTWEGDYFRVDSARIWAVNAGEA